MMMLMKFLKVLNDDADLVLVEQYIETQMILLQELWWWLHCMHNAQDNRIYKIYRIHCVCVLEPLSREGLLLQCSVHCKVYSGWIFS